MKTAAREAKGVALERFEEANSPVGARAAIALLAGTFVFVVNWSTFGLGGAGAGWGVTEAVACPGGSSFRVPVSGFSVAVPAPGFRLSGVAPLSALRNSEP